MADNKDILEQNKQQVKQNEDQLVESKKQTSEQQEQTSVFRKVLNKLTISNKNEDEANKLEKRKFADMLKERAKSARAAIVSAPGKALSAGVEGIKEGAGNALKGIGGVVKSILGPAGIFGLMLVFLKALQNPKFREVVSSLIDFVKGVFTYHLIYLVTMHQHYHKVQS